jgi:hypothetical protein
MSIGAELVPADQRGDLVFYRLNEKTGKRFDWGWWIAGYKRAVREGDIDTVKVLLVLALANGLD